MLSLELQNKGLDKSSRGLLVLLALILLIGSLKLRELIALCWVHTQAQETDSKPGDGVGGGRLWDLALCLPLSACVCVCTCVYVPLHFSDTKERSQVLGAEFGRGKVHISDLGDLYAIWSLNKCSLM